MVRRHEAIPTRRTCSVTSLTCIGAPPRTIPTNEGAPEVAGYRRKLAAGATPPSSTRLVPAQSSPRRRAGDEAPRPLWGPPRWSRSSRVCFFSPRPARRREPRRSTPCPSAPLRSLRAARFPRCSPVTPCKRSSQSKRPTLRWQAAGSSSPRASSRRPNLRSDAHAAYASSQRQEGSSRARSSPLITIRASSWCGSARRSRSHKWMWATGWSAAPRRSPSRSNQRAVAVPRG